MKLGRDLLVAALRPRPPQGPLTPRELDLVRRLVVVRAHDQLGDFLLATPALYALRQRFAGAHVTLVVNQFLAPMALHQPDVDRVVVAPWRRSPRGLWPVARFWREVTNRRYDLALVLNTVSHSLTSDVMARLSGAERVAGPSRPALKGLPGAPLYDWVFEPGPPVEPHQLARAAASLAALGCDPRPSGYRLALDGTALAVADRVEESLPAGRRVALHVGTKDPEKRYPASLWALAANRIAEACEAQLVLLDAPDARAETQSLAESLRAPHTRLGPLSLRETVAVVSRMQLLLCHDSALLHAAAAVGTPTVCVHGRGDMSEWSPPGDSHRGLQAESRRPADVPPEAVVAEALAVLSTPLASSHSQ